MRIAEMHKAVFTVCTLVLVIIIFVSIIRSLE
jgi:hypothetical protein